MKLIKLLQEASSLSLADIKKAMLKDPKVAFIFKKELSLSDISDVSSLLASLKFYVLNNTSVMDFVEKRDNIKYLNKNAFSRLRKLKTEEFNEEALEEVREFLTDLFKEHNSVQKSIMSPELKKELANWVDSNSRYHNLSAYAIAELRSNPNFRKNKKIVVYRGVLFTEGDLKNRPSFGDSFTEGNGLKFLKSIRKGNKTVDLSWDRPSSWTTNKSVAERFAKFGPASSQFMAMSKWLDRAADKREIDGDLGYVVSTLVDPKDVLIDMSVISTNLAARDYGEDEVILAPGKYLVKIVKKFTVDGEVNPDAEVIDNPVNSAVEYIKNEVSSFSIPEKFTSKEFTTVMTEFGGIPALKTKSVARLLITSAATTLSLHLHDKLSELYKKSGIVNLKQADFSADRFNTDGEINNASTIRKMFKAATSTVTHGGKKHTHHNLSADDYRTTLRDTELSALESSLLTRGSVGNNSEMMFRNVARTVGVVLPASFWQMGPTKQKPFIDAVVKGTLDILGLPFNEESDTENYKAFVNYLKKLLRNIGMLRDSISKINQLRSLV